MRRSIDSRHLDWDIRTTVGIDNPDDWKPGDTDRLFVRGIAILAADGDRFGYTDDQPQIIDGTHFTDESLAGEQHAAALRALQLLINGLRVP